MDEYQHLRESADEAERPAVRRTPEDVNEIDLPATASGRALLDTIAPAAPEDAEELIRRSAFGRRRRFANLIRIVEVDAADQGAR